MRKHSQPFKKIISAILTIALLTMSAALFIIDAWDALNGMGGSSGSTPGGSTEVKAAEFSITLSGPVAKPPLGIPGEWYKKGYSGFTYYKVDPDNDNNNNVNDFYVTMTIGTNRDVVYCMEMVDADANGRFVFYDKTNIRALGTIGFASPISDCVQVDGKYYGLWSPSATSVNIELELYWYGEEVIDEGIMGSGKTYDGNLSQTDKYTIYTVPPGDFIKVTCCQATPAAIKSTFGDKVTLTPTGSGWTLVVTP